MYNFCGNYIDCTDITAIICGKSGDTGYPYQLTIRFKSTSTDINRIFVDEAHRNREAVNLRIATERAKREAGQEIKAEVEYQARIILREIELLKKAVNRMVREMRVEP